VGLIQLVLMDIYKHIGPEDQAYFRKSREERFHTTLEEVVKNREARLPAFHASLDPLRRTVERQNFVSGKEPAYSDYILFGAFQWARAVSDFEVLAADDPIRAWRGRMRDLYDGLARRAPAYGGWAGKNKASIGALAMMPQILNPGAWVRARPFALTVVTPA